MSTVAEGAGLKIIGTDNFGRDHVADFLVADNVRNDYVGKIMVDALNASSSMTFFQLVPADYELSKGMEALV
ncbi:hypothetical protein [Mesorhizobium sp. GbtcB19]|uniref:hypothetical protein n=1 Tax=Mesorhizobium sp. GbtcB19 TaxID=2824764 RepID=UPI001C2FB180|nr:hypothetical protein [Mesorhizobium sp. GbtcB19]